MKYDSYFTTQYKECFVFFGIPTGTSVATKEVNQVCTMSGCVTTLVEVDNEDGYIWSTMPHLTLQLLKNEDKFTKSSIQICGGYTCGEEIKVFGINIAETRDFLWGPPNDYIAKCWTTSLAIPFSKWSENTTSIESAVTQQVKIPSKFWQLYKSASSLSFTFTYQIIFAKAINLLLVVKVTVHFQKAL